jgi:hypothetical protein
MSTVLKTTKELIEDLDLWIPFLAKKDKLELLKQANITRMKLENLEDAEIENGELTVEQEVVWDLCLKDIEYIEQQISLLKISEKNLLH